MSPFALFFKTVFPPSPLPMWYNMDTSKEKEHGRRKEVDRHVKHKEQ